MTLQKAAIAWVSTICIAAFGAASSAHAERVLLDRIEATVSAGGVGSTGALGSPVSAGLVLKSDIGHFRKTEPLRAQLDPLYSGTIVGAQKGNATDAQIVEYLIDEKLITQLFPVTDAEVEQEINSIQSNNKIDRNQLKAALAQQGFSFEDYFELIRSSTSKRNLIDRDIRQRVTISEADIKNYYYNKIAKSGAAARAYQLRIIFISPKTYKTAAAVNDAAKRALEAIKGGESFEEVARRMSDDATASSGGDLGTLTESEMNPSLREQVKKLQIGQVSDLIGSPTQGYYLVKLIDVKSEESAQIGKMAEEIRQQLTAGEYQHQIQIWLERQRQSAFIHRAGQKKP